MNYLKSEHLKFKRTIFNKLLFIIPLLTAVLAWLVGGFVGFQTMAIYWWYAFLLPGTIAIFCFLSHRKEEKAGNYASVYSMPWSLSKFEAAKSMILIEKLLVASTFLGLLICISNVIAPTTAVYSVFQSIVGSMGIVFASVWQIPLCLMLVRRTGLVPTIILNTLLGIFLPVVLGKTTIWWLIPYCYAAKLAETLMGIEINGTYMGNAGFSIGTIICVGLSMLLFATLSFLDIKDFSKRGGR